MTLTRLEVLRLMRTHRWMVLFGVYAFFGILGPLTAAYMEEIMARFGGGVEIAFPEPTPVDGIAQFVSNASQLGVLAITVVAAAALAVDAKPEVAAFLRTRIPQPVRLLIPRYCVVTLASVAALVTGTALAWAGTVGLIGDLPAGGMIAGTVLGALYVAFATALVAAVAGVTRSIVTTIFGSLAAAIMLPVLGILPALSPWMPSTLVTAVVDVAAGAPAMDYARAALMAVGLIPLLLWFAARRLASREL